MNDRSIQDLVYLYGSDWEGMEQATDGYPVKDEKGSYLIAGGKDKHFKATHIEFYGVNIKSSLCQIY